MFTKNIVAQLSRAARTTFVHLVKLYGITVVQDDHLEDRITPVLLATDVPARVRPLSSNERYSAGAPAAMINIRVTLGHRSDLAQVREIHWDQAIIRIPEPINVEGFSDIVHVDGVATLPDL